MACIPRDLRSEKCVHIYEHLQNAYITTRIEVSNTMDIGTTTVLRIVAPHHPDVFTVINEEGVYIRRVLLHAVSERQPVK